MDKILGRESVKGTPCATFAFNHLPTGNTKYPTPYTELGILPRDVGIRNCVEKQECLRRKLNIPSGTQQEICYAVHAEQNAIIQAAKYGICVQGATLYCTHQPCVICAKMIINAGISRVIYRYGYPDSFSLRLFEEAGVIIEKYQQETE